MRTVLGRYVEIAELDDDGLCCGAGGAYSQQHPDIADAVRQRKVTAIERTGATEVASANPGLHLALACCGPRRSPSARDRGRALAHNRRPSGMNDEMAELADRLDDTAERLAELSIELLQAALADADTSEVRSHLERKVTRARRATIKAASILRESVAPLDPHLDG